jgi:hypothetical protein
MIPGIGLKILPKMQPRYTWDLSLLSYKENFTIPSVSGIKAMAISPDGRKFYIIHTVGTGSANYSAYFSEYNCTVNHQIHTGLTLVSSINIGSIVGGKYYSYWAFSWSENGAYIYFSFQANDDAWKLARMNTVSPWSIAGVTGGISDTEHGESGCSGLAMAPDGYSALNTFDSLSSLKEFYTSSRYYLPTQAVSSKSTLEINSLYDSPVGLCVNLQGTQLVTIGDSDNDKIYQVKLTVPWKPTSAIFEKSKYIMSQLVLPVALWMNLMGTHLYVSSGTTFYRYSQS